MSNSKSKGSTSARSKASGFSLDYACSLSVRRAKSKARASAKGSRKEG